MNKVLDKTLEEYKATKEFKKADKLSKEVQKGFTSKEGVTAKKISDYNIAADKANKKGQEIAKKYVNEMTSAALKDLKYADTKAGRDYIKKILYQ